MEILPHEIPNFDPGFNNGDVVEAQYSKEGSSMQLIRKPVVYPLPHAHEKFNFGRGLVALFISCA